MGGCDQNGKKKHRCPKKSYLQMRGKNPPKKEGGLIGGERTGENCIFVNLIERRTTTTTTTRRRIRGGGGGFELLAWKGLMRGILGVFFLLLFDFLTKDKIFFNRVY